VVILDESGYVRHIGDGRHVSHPDDVQSASGRHDDALRTPGQALAIQPENPETLNHLGLTLKNLGRLEESLASYDRALAIQPDYADALNNRGNTLQRLGRLAEALASYDRALALRPDDAITFNNRGNILQLLGRFEDALSSYDKALALRPDYVKGLKNRGLGLQEMGRLEEALSSYDKALAIRPGYVDALDKRSLILTQLGRFEEALRSYDRTLAISPDNVEALNDRGNVLHRLRRFEEALSSYDQALALRPDLAVVLHNRGNALKDLNRFEAALASTNQALAIQPNFADAHNNRGNVLQKLWRFDDALSSYDVGRGDRPQPRSDRACRRARANQGQALRVAAKTRPALTVPARGGCGICGRDGRMPAARVKPKNGPQRSEGWMFAEQVELPRVVVTCGGDYAGRDEITSGSICIYGGPHEPSRPLLRGHIISPTRRTIWSQCRNEPPRTFAISKCSIDRVDPRCDRKFKPVALGQNQTAADKSPKSAIAMLPPRPFRESGTDAGDDFIFTCKETSHKALYDFIVGAEPERHAETIRKGKAVETRRYRWITGVPLRDGKDAALVNNWVACEIVDRPRRR